MIGKRDETRNLNEVLGFDTNIIRTIAKTLNISILDFTTPYQPHYFNLSLWGLNGMESYARSCEEFDRSVLTALLAVVSETPLLAANEVLKRFSTFQHATRADHRALSEIVGEEGASLLRTILLWHPF